MTTKELLTALTGKQKGTVRTITLDRMIDLKGGSGSVRKTSTFQARIGVKYGNKKELLEAIKNGERDAPELRDWEEMYEVKDNDGRKFQLRRHKNTKEVYLPLDPSKNKNSIHKTVWEVKGKEVSYEEIESELYAKDKKKDRKPGWYTVKVEGVSNIV
jgi:hypothetical protein